MAPEQAADKQVDEHADVYALGASLYHVVSGAIPHEGATFDEMVHRLISGHVRLLAERVLLPGTAEVRDPGRQRGDQQAALRRALNCRCGSVR